ncbi:MAG: peptidoglycan-binding protein [Clostridia bacterium]|nr:peptidoglycan-binding protein [Clostridia bacterium]
MKRRVFWGILVAYALCLFVFCTMAVAEETHRDITDICKFEVGPLNERVSMMMDGNPLSAWVAPNNTERHLRLYKPRGVATLSVLWDTRPRDLVLYREDYAHRPSVIVDYGEAASVMDFFVLPEAAGVYYLSTSRGMSMAEVRVHTGELKESFFSTHGYPPGAVNEWPAAARVRPLRRNDTRHQVYAMKQTLKALGYDVGKMNRVLDETAYLALMDFQRASGLLATGVLDYATLQALESPSPQDVRFLAAQPTEALLPRTASALVEFMIDKVGSAYLYGASGRVTSPTYRAIIKRQYPEYDHVISNYCFRFDGIEAYDCIGLFKAFLDASEGEFPSAWRTNVTGSIARWMTKPEPIDTMPREPGIILLQQNVGTAGFMHVGLYVGDGLCVHARGHRYGVVAEPMPQLWTHWARPTWLTYDLPEEPHVEWPPYMAVGERVLVDTSTGNTLNLYSRPVSRRRFWTGLRIPNYTELVIREVPEDDPYYRKVTMRSNRGDLYVGYVFAKDLSLLDPPQIER